MNNDNDDANDKNDENNDDKNIKRTKRTKRLRRRTEKKSINKPIPFTGIGDRDTSKMSAHTENNQPK